jgi:hypothetical protein
MFVHPVNISHRIRNNHHLIVGAATICEPSDTFVLHEYAKRSSDTIPEFDGVGLLRTQSDRSGVSLYQGQRGFVSLVPDIPLRTVYRGSGGGWRMS